MKNIAIIVFVLLSVVIKAQSYSEEDLSGFSSIELKATSPEEPVSMNSKIFPSPEGSDAIAYLAVKVKVHENWHIYAYVPEGGFFIQSEIKLNLPDGINASLVKEPQTHGYDADPQIMLYKGDLLFVYELKSSDLDKSDNEIRTTLSYQACDPYACLPPNAITVKNQLTFE